MSAPDTNMKKQKRRHKPALIGIGAAVLFGIAMMIGLGFFVVDNADEASETINTNPANVEGSGAAPVDEVEPGTNESN
jgi:hypothetical protein